MVERNSVIVQNITVQKLVIALVALAAFVAAPWICSETLEGNMVPFSLILGLGFLLFFVFVLGDKCWLTIPLCLPMGGSINILPIHFSPFELSILLVIGYVLIQFIMTDRRSFSFGPPSIWIPLLIMASILMYHWGRGGGFGLTMFGGEASGGRRFFTILVGMLALPAILWFPPLENRWLNAVPLLYFLGCLLDFVPWLVSTLAPGFAPTLYRLYSTVNLDAYASSSGFYETAVTRFGPLGLIGLGLQVALISFYPARLWIRPNYWFVPVLSVLCLVGVIFSGFRSFLFNYALVTILALFFSVRWSSLLLIPLGAVTVAVLCLGQGSAFDLPLSIQRTLSPLPGNWSPIAKEAAESSDTFRDDIQRIYRQEFFSKAGLFGDGYKYDQRFMWDRALSFSERERMRGADETVRGFIEVRDHHVGWVAVHHPIGTIGFGAFIVLCASSMVLVFRSLWKVPLGHLTPAQVWASALTAQAIISFFAVFGALQNFMPQLCVLLGTAIVSYRKVQELPAEASAETSPPSALTAKPVWSS
ncbi:MAG: hypothetical protein EBT50_07765 [Verrucomicrobia bacterium]|jgi:hypothetical protein|nr:hypothetical protein [Verrucomicrobiota bacterium]